MTILRPSILFGALACAGAAAQETPNLGEALGLGIQELHRLPALESDALAKIAALTAVPAKSLAGAERFTGTLKGGKQIRASRVPLRDHTLGSVLVLATDASGKFVAAAILDKDSQPTQEWQPLLKQFEWRPLPTLATARPKSTIATIRKRVEASDEKSDRLTGALIRLMGHMQDQAALFNVPRPWTKEQERRLIAQSRDAYRSVAKLGTDLTPLLGEQADRFAELANRSADIGSRMLTAFDAGDAGTIRRERRALIRSCNACHSLTGLKVPGKLKEASRDKRDALGIGDGYLLLGYDIRVAHADRAKAQRVLDCLRQAALILDAPPK